MPATEHHLSVQRTARFYTSGARIEEATRAWFVCHGYAQLAARFITSFDRIADERTLIVAPEALSRDYIKGTSGMVGASWMTREDRLHEIADYVAYLDDVARQIMVARGHAPLEVCALGFSQGAATAARWCGMGLTAVDRLVLWGGLLPPDLPEAAMTRIATVPLTFVLGTTDILVDREALGRQRAAVAEAGGTVMLVEFEGGHRLDAPTLERL